MPRSKDWSRVASLIEEQKYEEARVLCTTIRAAAQKSGNSEEWTEAMIKEVQLQIALHGYETAVRALRSEAWPQDPLSQVALELYYAHSLMSYLQAYSWEIGRRERVETRGPIDLKVWSKDQIYGEAQRAYARVFARRDELSRAPISLLKEYVQPGGYPEHVRGTLRDAVTYLAVELLANSAHWRPVESNELFRLDFGRLLTGQLTQEARAIDDEKVHPLLRAMAALDDLERFHQSQGDAQREAALEARLERLRRLHQHFTGRGERTQVLSHLASLLSGYRAVPWWSMGKALQSELVREGSSDSKLAYEIAAEGKATYPDSTGGRICDGQMRAISAADFSLESMQSDGLGKRSLRIRHKNLAELHFRAYSADLFERLENSQDYNLLYNSHDLQRLLRGKQPVASWVEKLPPTPDYQMHSTYVTPPLKQRGWHIIVVSLRSDFGTSNNRIVGANLVVTDLVLVTRNIDKNLEVTVVAGATGQPQPGAMVHVYELNYGNKHRRLDSEKTDANGIARFNGSDGKSVFVVAQQGDSVALDPNNFYFGRRYREPSEHASLVYTDRSIYRPDQKLYFKVVAYSGRREAARMEVEKGAKLSVVLLDANSQEVGKQDLTSNEFGSAAGEFLIPSGRLLGNWRVEVRGSYSGQTGVRVEEYKRPTFEVSLKDPTEALRLGRAATLPGEARYFFGLPVTSGKVVYRVSREPVYPWWWGYFGFATPGGSQTVANGTAEIDASGHFKIVFTPSADERQAKEPGGKDISYRYLLKADLTDEGGETRSASRSFRLGWVSIEAQIGLDVGFVRAGGPEPGGAAPQVTVRRTSLDGVPRSGDGTFRLVALKSTSAPVMPADLPALASEPADEEEGGATGQRTYHTPGDGQRPRWNPGYSDEATLARLVDGAEQQRGKLRHDDKGEALLKLPALPGGAYRLRYETQDEFGQKVEAWKDFVVADSQPSHAATSPLPFVVRLKSAQVSVGQTARLYVGSGFAGQAMTLEIFRSGQLVERRALQGSTLIEYPISEDDRGGLGLVVWMVRDHQYLNQQLAVQVPWDNKALQISFESFRDKLRPGARESFRIKVRGSDGALLGRGMAELLAYMYDRSLDLFAPHHPPSPLSLFPYRGNTVWSRSSLAAASTQWVVSEYSAPGQPSTQLGASSLTFYESYGIGGPGMAVGGGGFGRGGMLARSGAVMMAAPSMAPAAPRAAAPGAPPPAQASAAPKREGEALREQARAEPDAKPKDSGGQGEGGASGNEPPQIRSNFAETAFFAPALLLDKDGSTVVEFQVPDSVTAWNVWVHAITKDLRSGSLRRDARTVKELMVRPYLPRFFREGDSADLKVMVNNAGDRALNGSLRLEILDPDSKEPRHALFQVQKTEHSFQVDAGKSVTVSFPLSAPRAVGEYAFQVVARAGDLSDGELRPLPVLPSRMHLAESRFVTLRDKDQRTLSFPDMAKNDDATRIHEQLVVTLDNQLFYTVLKALPYLVTYPYECVEQTANRFLSTGIVSSLYRKYPAVSRMAEEFSKRSTQLERFDGPDANRPANKMTLEESPWLQQAQGGRKPGRGLLDFLEPQLINVLNPTIARAQRDSALSRLRKMQTSLGGFPWFPGGPPSPYMTLYLMNGFAKAVEFQVDVPKDMVQRGWQYLAQHFREDYLSCLKKNDCSREFLTFLNYVASAYPDASWTGDALTVDERKQILDYTFKGWKELSPLSKGQLALTLRRMGRAADGKLVWASVMDSAKSAPDQGVFWAAEDRSWLWYRDTIETHAFALRVLMELEPENAKKDGLVLWLLLNKKLNQWKSTRATAEVIYSLIHYLKQEGALGIREDATVHIGSNPSTALHETFVFEPDKYVGKTQIVVPGARLASDPAGMSAVRVEKQSKGYMFASATWHYSTDRLPSEGRGDFFQVQRSYFKRVNNGQEFVLKPLAEGEALQVGDEVEVHVSLRSKHEAEYVHLRDPRAAGLEPEAAVSRYKWDLGLVYYEEVRDSGMNFFFERLPVGEYLFKYRLRANMGGTFRVGPATVQSMYAPEFNAFSAGHVVQVK